MFKVQILAKIQQHYPKFQIRYKNQSRLMRIWGWILCLFGNASFMTAETDKIGHSVYFPSESFVSHKPVTSLVMLLHEATHLYYERRCIELLDKYLGLLAPFFLLSILLAGVIGLWLYFLGLFGMAFLTYLCFSAHVQKQADLSSLYCMHVLNTKHQYHIDLQAQGSFFLTQFSKPVYWGLRIFSDPEKEFDQAITDIQANNRPYVSKVFDLLDDILLEA